MFRCMLSFLSKTRYSDWLLQSYMLPSVASIRLGVLLSS